MGCCYACKSIETGVDEGRKAFAERANVYVRVSAN